MLLNQSFRVMGLPALLDVQQAWMHIPSSYVLAMLVLSIELTA